MKFRYALIAICLLSVVPAHAQQGGGANSGKPQQTQQQQPRREKQFPLGASWVAVTLNDKPLPRGAERPSFTVDQTLRMRGFGGCNTFSATAYPLRGQTFAVGPFALTKRSCSKEIEAAERAFFIALRTAQQWDIVGGQLVLRGQAGVVKAERSL
ncbi:MAG: META domain-containing protein [Chelatococcus sp.]|jgi:heat shock protein HslJ|uniref:META domain-containing protein n=1 Tax=unclassified Chelatococcus TaxID=2638111 RepID=UPI001BD1B398|nr:MULTISPECIES: META domain-containing protein [unclassified Chelatococcus]CAH1649239.1 Heat shock protein HslJ [Hyphomicrobiales bacterium]MBS7739581.1 META domain-containing protein [Chelatococcus sp. HY11]MBX3537610.1 META domain-containing protein [Chelatococcus sp.]MBX3543950.1 META domain-containing protein [Chelatococcus sp.]MCO5075882.1 META domain-containing protein [Chelatococcus sp.]